MNIGIVTTWFERGAAYVSRQFRDVLASEHDVFIYARGGEKFAIGDANWDLDYVTWAKKPATFAFTDINPEDFQRWLISNNIELVIFNEQKIWAPVMLCRELRIKTGAYIDYYTEQTVDMFALYDFLICNTQKHRSVFAWHPQCLFIPWGTDISLYLPKSETTAQHSGVTFFHSAGMSPFRKGTDLLLQAFSLLTGDAKLYLHSQVPLKTAFPQLSDNIDNLVAKQQLFIHEGTVAAPGLYDKGDVYVYPSRLDGIGLTILEAASAGLPVIVPDYGPMNEFVAADVNGRTVALDKLWARWDGYYWPQCEVNIAALAAAMQSYVDNAGNMPQYAMQARQYAEKHFNWQHNSAGLAQLLTQITLQSAASVSAAEQQARKYDATLFQRHAKSSRQRWMDNFEEQSPVLYRLMQSLKSALRRG